MSKTMRNNSFKHLRKNSNSFNRTEHSIMHRASERLKTIQHNDNIEPSHRTLEN